METLKEVRSISGRPVDGARSGACRTQRSLAERHVCGLIAINRESWRYLPTEPKDAALRKQLRELAAGRAHFGHRNLQGMLLQEKNADGTGWRQGTTTACMGSMARRDWRYSAKKKTGCGSWRERHWSGLHGPQRSNSWRGCRSQCMGGVALRPRGAARR
jgi:hypothetical protein